MTGMQGSKRIAQHIGAFLVVVLAGCASSPHADERDLSAIEATLKEQTAAWNRGDLHAFVAGYAESPERMTFVGSKGDIVRGRAALEERYRKNYPEGKRGFLKFSDLDCRRIGPDAWLVLGRWSLEELPDAPHGVFTLVFERGPEGRLQIVHDHSS